MHFYSLGRKLKFSMASGALVAVAVLVQIGHDVVIIDENVEPIDFNALQRFDVVGVTGMVVQAERMCEILQQLRTLPAVVAVGGPFVTLNEGTFETLFDGRFIGEAEETWPPFLNALASRAPTDAPDQQAHRTVQ